MWMVYLFYISVFREGKLSSKEVYITQFSPPLDDTYIFIWKGLDKQKGYTKG